MYSAEARGVRTAKRRAVNMLEMKCLRNLIGVAQMDRAKDEDVCRRAGMER